jgi:choline dehydrogenase-like flavoprotein
MAEELSADYLVIGSGIIGSLAARKLALAGASVLILEAGPRVSRGEIVARFRNTTRRGDWMSPYPSVATAPHPIYQPEGQRLPGAGRPVSVSGRIHPPVRRHLVALGRAGLAQRAERLPHPHLYGVGVDWPISYEDLEPFYQEAEEIMGVSAPTTRARRASRPSRWIPWRSRTPCAASASASTPRSRWWQHGGAQQRQLTAARPAAATTAASRSAPSTRNTTAASPRSRPKRPA